jgi:predicted alpha/beta superfamily hydrolase
MEDCRYNKDNGFFRKGAAFFEFIGGELLPYIEKKYRIAV